MEKNHVFFALGKYDQISVSSRSLTSLWLHHDVGGIARGLSWPEVSVKFSKFILSQMSTIHIWFQECKSNRLPSPSQKGGAVPSISLYLVSYLNGLV